MRTASSPGLLLVLLLVNAAILITNPVVGMITAAGLCLMEHLRSRPRAPTDDGAVPDDARRIRTGAPAAANP